MNKVIVFDSYPLFNLSRPLKSSAAQEVKNIREWAAACDLAGHKFVIPEIIDYEVRRELIPAQKFDSVAELNKLQDSHTYLPLTTVAIRKAAELWAQARQQGKCQRWR